MTTSISFKKRIIDLESWSPSLWRSFPMAQSVEWGEKNDELLEVEKQLSQYPPLVIEHDVLRLKNHLKSVAQGDAFLLQGGDCAESFNELRAENIQDTLKVILQMAIVLTYTFKKPVVKLGRVAGQFAKPRSSFTEKRNGLTLPAYRGDIINGFEFSKEARTPNPQRLLKAYFHSAATLNILQAYSKGGFADLHQIHSWNLAFTQQKDMDPRYHRIVNKIDETLAFLKATGVSTESPSELSVIDFFSSHEALLLNYEEALVRSSQEVPGRYFAGSSHFLWIGERTRQLDGAHVAFAKGIQNPIGLKCGPEMDADELIRLIDVLNPENENGRITLIPRMGFQKVESRLPQLIRRVREEGRNVVWCCDPMHGNSFITNDGIKTRHFKDILSEVHSFFEIHKSENTVAGGVHLELTGRNVTECIGGATKVINESLITETYETLCDPRLNANQALELVFQLIK